MLYLLGEEDTLPRRQEPRLGAELGGVPMLNWTGGEMSAMLIGWSEPPRASSAESLRSMSTWKWETGCTSCMGIWVFVSNHLSTIRHYFIVCFKLYKKLQRTLLIIF